MQALLRSSRIGSLHFVFASASVVYLHPAIQSIRLFPRCVCASQTFSKSQYDLRLRGCLVSGPCFSQE